MTDWVCYLIMSLDSNDTYIGSSNNQARRLCDHNNRCKSRRGAKRTRGQTWAPILFISGFNSKNACLSFEAGWKRLSKRRSNSRLELINCMVDDNLSYTLSYTRDPKWNRLMDLVYFTNNISFINGKFKLNHNFKHPIEAPNDLVINIFTEEWISELPFPYFVDFLVLELKNSDADDTP